MVFKNSSGRFFTKSLFFEMTLAHRPHAVYTLKDNDHTDNKGVKYVSLKRLFLACTDPTEYTFATTHLGGWQHWKDMQTTTDLIPHIEEWREERDVKLRSIGIQKLISQAEEGDSFQAAKYLADKGWDANTKGRPSKAQVTKAAKEEASVRKVVSGDFDRIRNING